MDGLLERTRRGGDDAGAAHDRDDGAGLGGARVMNAQKITTLFATDPARPERPAGILHIHDCLRAGVG